ncbi:AidA/PixA family protein [Pseudoalteromonas fenneropenaei]|uniref:AidA/PixA family protein n=1 Tax=Pseudoalteromonas fenneropenaei TaxID=1737459 RepID=A0ABV7CHM8_9GAMM
MSQINVLVAVDGAKLAQQVADGSLHAGSAGSPTLLGSYGTSDVYISMIAQHSVAVNDQGQSELTIKAQSGDIISWFMTTFGNNTDHSATIYNASFNPSNGIQAYGSTIQEENNYLPPADNTSPSSVTRFTNTFSSYSAKLTKVNQHIQYYMSFVLVDNSNGHIIGYFAWDPFINVN